MATDPSNLFTSSSRTKSLLALYELQNPVSLHELNEITETTLCALHNALTKLELENLVIKKRKGKETHYRLNRKKPALELIKALADAKEKLFISDRAKKYHKRAQQSLRFSSDSLSYLSKVRELNANT